MTDHAILGTFADFKLIRSRGQAQIIVEIPMEEADRALAALGGLPTDANSRWVAVARPPSEQRQTMKQAAPKGGELSRRAAILCADPRFRKWLSEVADEYLETEEQAARKLRTLCGVESRVMLDHDESARREFLMLVESFDNWKQWQRATEIWGVK